MASGTSKPQHPCWHCTERHAACCTECERWKAYEEARTAWYKAQAKAFELKELENDIWTKRENRVNKRRRNHK